MPQIPRQLRLAFQRYFSGNAVARWICKKQAIILSDPRGRAIVSWTIHYVVLTNSLFFAWYFHVDFVKFVRLTAWAFYASGSFALLCAVIEYIERRNVCISSSQRVEPLSQPNCARTSTRYGT